MQQKGGQTIYFADFQIFIFVQFLQNSNFIFYAWLEVSEYNDMSDAKNGLQGSSFGLEGSTKHSDKSSDLHRMLMIGLC